MRDRDCSACSGDFGLCPCESAVCPVLVQGLLEHGDNVGFPVLSWESGVAPTKPDPLGSCGMRLHLGVTAEAAGTRALLFTELMKYNIDQN